ncbi:MAG: cupin domain-containing protein [Methyloceanibacter sp.]
MRRVLLLGAVLACGLGAGALLAREPAGAPAPQREVTAKELLQQVLQGEPGKEVNMQVYTFPPGASVPWHIHPDAHEFDYAISGTLTLEIEGEPKRELKAGEAVYVPPNVVHRGMNLSTTEPMQVFVVRVKPKDAPLTTINQR